MKKIVSLMFVIFSTVAFAEANYNCKLTVKSPESVIMTINLSEILPYNMVVLPLQTHGLSIPERFQYAGVDLRKWETKSDGESKFQYCMNFGTGQTVVVSSGSFSFFDKNGADALTERSGVCGEYNNIPVNLNIETNHFTVSCSLVQSDSQND